MSHYEAEESEVETVVNAGKTVSYIKPLGLHIVWGKDNRYWQLPEKNSTTGPRYAELKQVCWLEITGSLPVEAGKTYAIQFEVSMKQDAFGWTGCPLFMMAKLGKKGKYSWKKINLIEDQKKQTNADLVDFSIPGDQPLTISVPVDASEKTIFFGLYEVWSGKWKGGLQIHKAIITEK